MHEPVLLSLLCGKCCLYSAVDSQGCSNFGRHFGSDILRAIQSDHANYLYLWEQDISTSRMCVCRSPVPVLNNDEAANCFTMRHKSVWRSRHWLSSHQHISSIFVKTSSFRKETHSKAKKLLVTACKVKTIFPPCNNTTRLVRSHPKSRFKLA